jgi:hypothetical protein
MKGYQYRLIISLLIVMLVISVGYMLFLDSENQRNAQLAESCIKENQKLFEERLDPEYAGWLDECRGEMNNLEGRLEGLESNFTDYCGLFGALDASAGLKKVESVRFTTSINIYDMPNSETDFCGIRFLELVDKDPFYPNSGNYECSIIGMKRFNFKLDLSCICGYYSNPKTKVVLPKEIS